jgi:hypothetical protein
MSEQIYFSTANLAATGSVNFSLPTAYGAGDGGSREFAVTVICDIAAQANLGVNLTITQGGTTLLAVGNSSFGGDGVARLALVPNPAAGLLTVTNTGPAVITSVTVADEFPRATG